MSKKRKGNLIAGGIGNVLEWYDFAVYGYFATVISGRFFPEEDKVAALIATFGIFAVGFLVRPLGGAIFGSIGDRLGRKTALTWSVFLMAIPTTLIGVIPTYEAIGFWAPIILMALRLLQGLSVGGELTGSISFITETAPSNKRGLYGSTTLFGAVLGILIGSGVGAILTNSLDSAKLSDWGWRLPFLAGILIGLAGLLLRRNMREGDTFKAILDSGETVRSPLKEFWKNHKSSALVSTLAIWAYSTSFYMIFLYLTSYEHTFLNYDLDDALSVNTIAMAVLLGMILLMGFISDKIGRKKVLIGGCVGLLLFSIPLFLLVDDAQHWHILLAQVGFSMFVGSQQGVMPTALVERYPAKIRATAISVSYNVGLALFGGTTPMLSTWLIKKFDGNLLAPAFYLMLSALVSLIAISQFKETYKHELK